MCLILYKFNKSEIVGYPAADSFPASRVAKVRYPPNLGQSNGEMAPLSLMTNPIIGTCHSYSLVK